MSNQNYGEIFCTAVHELITAELSGLQFDITKNCTIIDVKDRSRGKYKVSDGSIVFEAYASGMSVYELNDQVLVNIPQGDYNKQKTILNKVINISDTITYINPLDTMIKGTGNLCHNLNREAELVANGSEKLKKICTITDNHFGFTRLGISADFKSLLNGLDVISGIYGLRFLVYGNKNNQSQVLDLNFPSMDMLGNPYEFSTYFNQQIVFTIPDYVNSISKIEVYFYQDGDFKNSDDILIVPLDEKIFDLFVKNLEVYLGYAAEDIKEKIELAAPVLSYSNPDDERLIYLRWFHKNENDVVESINFLNWDPKNYEIRWYRYMPGCPLEETDEYGGENWQYVNKEIPSLAHAEYPFVYIFLPNIARTFERFKVVGFVHERPLNNDPNYIITTNYCSNILEFKNIDERTAGGNYYEDMVSNGLSLRFNDNSDGNYFLYDQNGILINKENIGSTYKRDLQVVYNGEEINKDCEIYTQINSITWDVPTENTMILSDDNDNSELNTIFTYSIQNYWYQSRGNNTITCTVNVNGNDFILTETLRFGPKGSNGTNNTFLLEILDGKNALAVNGNDKKIRVRAILIDTNGKEIYFSTEEATKIKWKIINLNSEHMSMSTNESIATITANTNTVPNNNYAILEAQYRYDPTGPILMAYLPIPMKSTLCAGMTGATQIIYNHQGIPSYNNNPFVAYQSDGSKNKNWNLNQDSKNPNPVQLKNTSSDSGSGVALSAAALYSKKEGSNDPIQDKVCVYCTDMWSQPILIIQSQYDFAMLNSWDGSLTIDEENGIILATMLGAGRKNSQNQFSGVLIGDIKDGTNLNNTEKMTGVYGFQDGIMSYALKEDGTAFFGASGKARIEIDGKTGIICSTGWMKNNSNWFLPENMSGTLIDLDDGMLLMEGGNNNYLRFNRDIDNDGQNDGKLELSLSGLDLILNDKEVSLSPYVDGAVQGLINEVRRSATYYGVCNTIAGVPNKIIELITPIGNDFKEADENNNYGVEDTVIDSLLKTGITIAVKFNYGEEILKENIYKKENNETYIDYIKRTGQSLYLQLNGSEISRPIYINGKATNNISSHDDNGNINLESNFYSWDAGNTIYFIFTESKDGGYWTVTDSGSYSQVIQTADVIRTEVSKQDHSLSTNMTQTADSIRLEARRIAGYYGVCNTADGIEIKEVQIQNLPNKELLTDINDFLQNGIGLAVTFVNKKTSANSDSTLKFTVPIKNEDKIIECPIYKDGKPISENEFTWVDYSTVYFIYQDGIWNITDSGNYSRITQTAADITSEVRRTATYYGTCKTSSSNSIKTVDLYNAYKGTVAGVKVTNEELYQRGVTIAVTFTNEEKTNEIINSTDDATIISTKGRQISLSINDKEYPIYINNKITSSDNPFGWSAGSTVYFVYDSDGYWRVADSGSYSRITQTADMIKSEVRTENNKLSSTITQTAKEIRSEVSAVQESLDGTKQELSSSISQTAEAIRTEVARKANYYAVCETPAGNNPKYIKFIDEDRIALTASGLSDGLIIMIYFSNASSITSNLKFVFSNSNASSAFTEQIPVQDDCTWEAGQTFAFVYENGRLKLTSLSYSSIMQSENRILTKVGDTLQNYSTTTQTASAIQTYVEGALQSYSTTSQTNDQIFAAVSGKLDEGYESSAFSWSLTNNGFYLNNNTTADSNNYIFRCDSGGLWVNGNGNFSGNLTAAKTSFNSLQAGAISINGVNYYSTFTPQQVKIVVGTDKNNSTGVYTNGGELIIGAPNYTTYDDVSLYARVINETQGQVGYGNLGLPDKKWDTLSYVSIGSKRNFKQDIQVYNIEQAYEELKTLPIYTYRYKGNGDSSRTLSLGSMIDYMPIEFMRTTYTEDGTMFEPNNIIFWNIAAAQVMQLKLENLINRVEQLELKEVN